MMQVENYDKVKETINKNLEKERDRMGKYIKTVIPGCIGASVAVTFAEYFRHPDLWRIGDFIVNLFFIFIVATIIASICFWTWARMKRK